MPNSLRGWIEAHLPWCDPDKVRQRDERTASVAFRSELARARAERVIAAYRAAEATHDVAAERLIDEARH